MRKLLVPPSQAGYGAQFGEESLYVALSGGPGAFRRDFVGAVARVSVSWSVPPQEAQYLLAFYRYASAHASEPFLIDLALDSPDLLEYTAKIIPGSFALTGYRGNERTYTAELEVKPQTEDAALDISILDTYEAFGGESGVALAYSELEALVNENLAGALG